MTSASRPRRPVVAAACLVCLDLWGCGTDDGDRSRATERRKGWKDTLATIASELTLGAEKGILFYAVDTLAVPGRDVQLVARATYVKELEHIPGLTVRFSLDGQPVAAVETDQAGFARARWTPPAAGDYEFLVEIVAAPKGGPEDPLQVPPASLLVCARVPETKFVVIDLDHTVVDSSFLRVIFLGGGSPMPGAADVVRELAKTYTVIYLTHRPDLLGAKSKRWLAENGFPRAPLLVSTLRQSLGSSREYKTARLKAIRRTFPNLAVGIGDRLTDAQAYTANGMTAYLLPHYDRQDEEELRDLARAVRKLNGAVQVVDSWQQIRAGILEKHRYPPAEYARKLLRRAEELRRSRHRKRRRDD